VSAPKPPLGQPLSLDDPPVPSAALAVHGRVTRAATRGWILVQACVFRTSRDPARRQQHQEQGNCAPRAQHRNSRIFRRRCWVKRAPPCARAIAPHRSQCPHAKPRDCRRSWSWRHLSRLWLQARREPALPAVRRGLWGGQPLSTGAVADGKASSFPLSSLRRTARSADDRGGANRRERRAGAQKRARVRAAA
jgi:hypothetical protein